MNRVNQVPVEVELIISDDVADNDAIPDRNNIQDWANAAYISHDDTTASLKILSTEEMQQLNKKYRGQDKTTNVLSFPVEIPSAVLRPSAPHATGSGQDSGCAASAQDEREFNVLGDLALCSDVIFREATEQGKNTESHWAHMVVHGMLHLQGYDHIADNEAGIMEGLEIKILKKLGFDNPYSQQHERM